jgi:hypothetical protein
MGFFVPNQQAAENIGGQADSQAKYIDDSKPFVLAQVANGYLDVIPEHLFPRRWLRLPALCQ